MTDFASTKRFVLVDSDQIELNDMYNNVHKVLIFMHHYCHNRCSSIRDLSEENKWIIGQYVGNAGTNVKMAQCTLPVKTFVPFGGCNIAQMILCFLYTNRRTSVFTGFL